MLSRSIIHLTILLPLLLVFFVPVARNIPVVFMLEAGGASTLPGNAAAQCPCLKQESVCVLQ